jgi:hypothetical protein
MTVGEMAQRMTTWELGGWALFEKEFGPLHHGLRLDGAVARAVHPFLKKGTPFDALMPWPKKPEGDEPASLEAVFGLFKTTAKPVKDK